MTKQLLCAMMLCKPHAQTALAFDTRFDATLSSNYHLNDVATRLENLSVPVGRTTTVMPDQINSSANQASDGPLTRVGEHLGDAANEQLDSRTTAVRLTGAHAHLDNRCDKL